MKPSFSLRKALALTGNKALELLQNWYQEMSVNCGYPANSGAAFESPYLKSRV